VVFRNGKVDPAGTAKRRAGLRVDRLARAVPPLHPVTDTDVADLATSKSAPLYPGVIQRGPVAFAEVSGTPLAIAPNHWTDGCAVLEEKREGTGPAVVVRAYLDPRTGTSLHVEAVPAGEPRSFEVSPTRWTKARKRSTKAGAKS
jgi:N-methylhydantoinase B